MESLFESQPPKHTLCRHHLWHPVPTSRLPDQKRCQSSYKIHSLYLGGESSIAKLLLLPAIVALLCRKQVILGILNNILSNTWKGSNRAFSVSKCSGFEFSFSLFHTNVFPLPSALEAKPLTSSSPAHLQNHLHFSSNLKHHYTGCVAQLNSLELRCVSPTRFAPSICLQPRQLSLKIHVLHLEKDEQKTLLSKWAVIFTCPERLGSKLRFEFSPQEHSRVQLNSSCKSRFRTWTVSSATEPVSLTSTGSSEHSSTTNDYFMFLGVSTAGVQLGWDMPPGSVGGTGVLCCSGLRQKTTSDHLYTLVVLSCPPTIAAIQSFSSLT